ncbi:hypothetical protein ABPG74_011075 [Tetrahymena malaccensis]
MIVQITNVSVLRIVKESYIGFVEQLMSASCAKYLSYYHQQQVNSIAFSINFKFIGEFIVVVHCFKYQKKPYEERWNIKQELFSFSGMMMGFTLTIVQKIQHCFRQIILQNLLKDSKHPYIQVEYQVCCYFHIDKNNPRQVIGLSWIIFLKRVEILILIITIGIIKVRLITHVRNNIDFKHNIIEDIAGSYTFKVLVQFYLYFQDVQ